MWLKSVRKTRFDLAKVGCFYVSPFFIFKVKFTKNLDNSEGYFSWAQELGSQLLFFIEY